MIVLLLVALMAGAAAPVHAAEKPARPRLCPEDAPEGVRLPQQAGCGTREVPTPKRDPGYHELGEGTGIYVGGRASAIFDGRR